jgi:Histone methylation protein DOT1
MEQMCKRAQRYRQAPIDEVAEALAALNLDVAAEKTLYDKLFASHPVSVGKAISKKEREQSVSDSTTLVYGEISFEAFAIILSLIKSKFGLPKGGIFTDLGSGTGKPVVAAALLHSFELCQGVEILEGLYTTSVQIEKMWVEDDSVLAQCGHKSQLQFVHGDATDFEVLDWSNSSVVLANSTCFDDALMRKIAACCYSLREGTIVITFTKPLRCDDLEVVDKRMLSMSWGGCSVFVHRKIR